MNDIAEDEMKDFILRLLGCLDENRGLSTNEITKLVVLFESERSAYTTNKIIEELSRISKTAKYFVSKGDATIVVSTVADRLMELKAELGETL